MRAGSLEVTEAMASRWHSGIPCIAPTASLWALLPAQGCCQRRAQSSEGKVELQGDASKPPNSKNTKQDTQDAQQTLPNLLRFLSELIAQMQ